MKNVIYSRRGHVCTDHLEDIHVGLHGVVEPRRIDQGNGTSLQLEGIARLNLRCT